MIVALILLGVLGLTALVLWLTHKPSPQDDAPQEAAEEEREECCGLHAICEKFPTEIIYYDDEELDRFKGRAADGYSATEVEEFRDVMLTLLGDDVAGWSRSLELRGISLPVELRDEMMLLIGGN